MKKLLLFIFLCITSITYAQTVEHAKFMGIPINGSPTEFGNKLIEKGFVFIEDDDQDSTFAYYYGYFAGTECIIGINIITIPIYQVLITSIDRYDNRWYDLMQSRLTIKYGEPFNLKTNWFIFQIPYGNINLIRGTGLAYIDTINFKMHESLIMYEL